MFSINFKVALLSVATTLLFATALFFGYEALFGFAASELSSTVGVNAAYAFLCCVLGFLTIALAVVEDRKHHRVLQRVGR